MEIYTVQSCNISILWKTALNCFIRADIGKHRIYSRLWGRASQGMNQCGGGKTATFFIEMSPESCKRLFCRSTKAALSHGYSCGFPIPDRTIRTRICGAIWNKSFFPRPLTTELWINHNLKLQSVGIIHILKTKKFVRFRPNEKFQTSSNLAWILHTIFKIRPKQLKIDSGLHFI